MSEEKVLISRTYVDKKAWQKLKLIASIMSERESKSITREDLVNLALISMVKYHEKEFKI